jgi:hypothetical protein
MSETFRTVSEQAEWLRLSEKTCRRHAAAMGAVRAGTRLLFPESTSLAWLESRSLRPRSANRKSAVAP